MPAKDGIDPKTIASDQFERLFDNGDDILAYVDMGSPMVEHHPPLTTHRRPSEKENVFRNL